MRKKHIIINMVDYILEKIVPTFMIILLLIMIILTASDIMARSFFSTSLAAARALTKFLFIWIIFLGISYGVRKEEHFKMTELLDKLPEKVQKTIKILIIVLSITFFAVLFLISTFKHMPMAWQRVEIATGVEARYFYLSIPIGSLLAIIALIRNFIDMINK